MARSTPAQKPRGGEQRTGRAAAAAHRSSTGTAARSERAACARVHHPRREQLVLRRVDDGPHDRPAGRRHPGDEPADSMSTASAAGVDRRAREPADDPLDGVQRVRRRATSRPGAARRRASPPREGGLAAVGPTDGRGDDEVPGREVGDRRHHRTRRPPPPGAGRWIGPAGPRPLAAPAPIPGDLERPRWRMAAPRDSGPPTAAARAAGSSLIAPPPRRGSGRAPRPGRPAGTGGS